MEQTSNYFTHDSSTLASNVVPEKDRPPPLKIPIGPKIYHGSADVSLFSTSLPVMSHEELNFNESVDKLKLADPLEDITLGTFLPDDEDELLAGVMDDFDLSGLPTQLEDLDDDFFGSGFGMEIEYEDNPASSFATDNLSVGTMSHYGYANGVATVSGEHPYGEHPYRTLFVRNINSNVEDSEIRSLFEQYGDIRTLYTACKHRGFVMISYYDIRDAQTAMRALQNKPLRRRKLDIHFSIPKDNPSEKDINQGTLVVFNLDPSVSNDDLRQIFGVYGEVKEIRETPHKRFHKFIEFYDARAAEAALKALNMSDIAGKRIKLEPSRPGGSRRSLLHQLNHEQEQDDPRVFWHQVGSPIGNSPPGSWSSYGSPVDQISLHGYNLSPKLQGLSPVGISNLSTPVKIPPIGRNSRKTSHLNPVIPGSSYQPHFSVPGMKLSSSPELTSSCSDSKSSSVGTLSGHQFLWGSPTVNNTEPNDSSHKAPLQLGVSFLNSTQQSSHLGSRLHVGSAPSGIPLERRFGFFPESPEFGIKSNGAWSMNTVVPSSINMGVSFAAKFSEIGSPVSPIMTMPRNNPMYLGNGSFVGININGCRSRRTDAGGQVENKQQYQLDLEKISNGEDKRTTLMIKNIPNKYTRNMLVATIDETHQGAYDFVYLPIDFKNKCNVGYAFINMVFPSHIITFYDVFNGKKWEKFNSEKVASLAYARIQGKTALMSHFQNSSLMSEDKNCRPIVFQSDDQQTSDEFYAGDSLDTFSE